jgi:2-polyprenyl-3-methyl-5-hydroxy-6-metoxy-1,4-benzoquinol methylase
MSDEWLIGNQTERMDATRIDLFKPLRAAAHRARYEFAAKHAIGRRVIDLGSGTGYGARIMRDAGAESVIGIEINPEAVAYAQSRHGGNGVQFQEGHAEDTAMPDGGFDLVTSFECIEHVDDDHQLIDEAARILADGGTLICSVPHMWNDPTIPHHLRYYDRLRLINLLCTRFTRVDLYCQNSGSEWRFNCGQPAGIAMCTDDRAVVAEWLIAIARK